MAIHPIQRIKKIVRWLKNPPERPNSRGMTILMWVLIVGTCGLVIKEDQQKDSEARAQAICVVNLVLDDFYDFIEEVRGNSTELTELRARLDRLAPPKGC